MLQSHLAGVGEHGRAGEVEAEIRADPSLRADRFVQRWRELDRQRARFARDNDWQDERKIRDSMGVMAKSLERDPQMEPILRNRSRDLGIPMDMGPGDRAQPPRLSGSWASARFGHLSCHVR